MLCAVIMAGGKGTRFWPLSTEEKPKQFLKLLGDKTMLQMTVDRLLPLIPLERIFVVTGKQYVDLVKKNLPNLTEENIIVEPMGKNTAPCIALSAFYINKRYKDATMVVVPSDHSIKEEEKFLSVIKTAEEFVERKKDSLVTIGITPTRPETAYGYIKFYKNKNYGESEITIDTLENNPVLTEKHREKEKENNPILPVIKFVEKPNLEKAKQYITSGDYLWNSGMFIWKSENILKLTSTHLENTYNLLKEVAIAKEEDYEDTLEKKYCEVDNISVDFGIMEKAENIYVIPGDLGWDDIGSWNALERYREKDEDNNIINGNIKVLNGKNNIIMGNEKPIVISGLDGIYLIESDDLIIIGKKEEMKAITEIKKNTDLQEK